MTNKGRVGGNRPVDASVQDISSATLEMPVHRFVEAVTVLFGVPVDEPVHLPGSQIKSLTLVSSSSISTNLSRSLSALSQFF